MQCPRCNNLILDTDPVCVKCRAVIPRGITRGQVAGLTAAAFAVATACLVLFVLIPPDRNDYGDIVVSLIAAAIVGASAVVGRVVGWLIGAAVRDG
jgi:hypothetical protein